REAAFDEAHHLVAPGVRTDEARVGFVMLEQPVLIGREAEEPALLDRPLGERALGRELLAGLGGVKLLLVIIGFVADRVPAFVAAVIGVALVRHRLPDRLAGAVMVGLGRPDEAIERDLKTFVHTAEKRRHLDRKRRRL